MLTAKGGSQEQLGSGCAGPITAIARFPLAVDYTTSLGKFATFMKRNNQKHHRNQPTSEFSQWILLSGRSALNIMVAGVREVSGFKEIAAPPTITEVGGAIASDVAVNIGNDRRTSNTVRIGIHRVGRVRAGGAAAAVSGRSAFGVVGVCIHRVRARVAVGTLAKAVNTSALDVVSIGIYRSDLEKISVGIRKADRVRLGMCIKVCRALRLQLGVNTASR